MIGGYHASLMPDEVQEHADTVCVGSGEVTWNEFLNDLENGVSKRGMNVENCRILIMLFMIGAFTREKNILLLCQFSLGEDVCTNVNFALLGQFTKEIFNIGMLRT